MRPDLSSVEALSDETWLALIGKLYSMKPSWCQCGALPNENLIGASIEALLDNA